jgi:hypothetical protein
VPSFVLYDPEGYRVAIMEVSEIVTKGKGGTVIGFDAARQE